MVGIIASTGRIIDPDIVDPETDVMMNKVPGFVYTLGWVGVFFDHANHLSSKCSSRKKKLLPHLWCVRIRVYTFQNHFKLICLIDVAAP